MKRTVTFCDRHDEGEEVVADETIQFDTAEGPMEVDVCVEHAEAWRAFEAETKVWSTAARARAAPPGPTPRGPRQPRGQRDLENKALRVWARGQGIELGDRGRISEEIRERFRREVGDQARTRWTAIVASGPGVKNGDPQPPTQVHVDRPVPTST